SVMPPSERTVRERLHYLDVTDPQLMKERLDPVTLDNFLWVAQEAVRRSGYDPRDITFLAPLHTKRSMFELLLHGLGLDESRAVYLDEYGHLSALDPIIGLWEGVRRGQLRAGDLAVALSAGTGYSWAATAIRWGPWDGPGRCPAARAGWRPEEPATADRARRWSCDGVWDLGERQNHPGVAGNNKF